MPIEGIEEGIANLEGVSDASWEKVVAAFNEECYLIMEDAVNIVPVDTGVLMQSIPAVSGPSEHSFDSATFILGAGGAASAYALRQHEDLTFHHKEGRTAKYIENPINQRAPGIPENIRARLGGK